VEAKSNDAPSIIERAIITNTFKHTREIILAMGLERQTEASRFRAAGDATDSVRHPGGKCAPHRDMADLDPLLCQACGNLA